MGTITVRGCGSRSPPPAPPPSPSPRAGSRPSRRHFPVATGWTVEIADPWGNIIGFTDYAKAPERGRS